MDLFQLANDESYDKRCGEIILTTKRNITIHCTLCEGIYEDFEAYVGHLHKQHLTSLISLEDSLSLEKTKEFDDRNIINTDAQDIVSKIKEEIQPLENDFLEEEELSIDSLLKDSRLTENEKEDSLSSMKNIELSKEIKSTDLDVPGVIRNVNKRTLRGPSIVPAEERKHKCPICGLGFKEKHNMNHHYRRHSTKKNHQCSECDKKFHTRTEVRIHMRFHTRERSFLCSHCGRSFLRSSHLSSHIKRHSNQRDFKCQICDKAFYENEALKRHMKGHSSERPFVCTTCSATFSRQSALRNHEKLHENKRQYKCSICGTGFNQQAGLFSHMKVVHKTT